MPKILGLVRSRLDARLFEGLAPAIADAGHTLVVAGTPEFLPDLDVERVGVSSEAPAQSSEGLLTTSRPDLVVTTRDDTPAAMSMVGAADHHGIPQLLVQTRVWMDRRAPHVRLRRRQWSTQTIGEAARRLTGRQAEAGLGGCTAIAAASDRFVTHLTERGVDSSRIHLTGTPLHGHRATEVEAQPGIADLTDSYTVYAHGPGIPPGPEIRELKRLHRFCMLSGTRLVVLFETPDPSHADALRAALPSDTLVLDADDNTPAVLQGSRAVLTCSSNLVLDAIALDRPIGLMRYLPVRGELNLGKATIGIDHRRDLEMRVIGLLTDPGLRDMMLAMYPELLESETHNADGGATKRLLAIAERLLQTRSVAA